MLLLYFKPIFKFSQLIKKIKTSLKKPSYFWFSIYFFFCTFQCFLKHNIKSLFNYIRNVSWKFEVSSSKNKGDRFLVNLKTTRKLILKNLWSICLYWKLLQKHLYFKNNLKFFILQKLNCSLYSKLSYKRHFKFL